MHIICLKIWLDLIVFYAMSTVVGYIYIYICVCVCVYIYIIIIIIVAPPARISLTLSRYSSLWSIAHRRSSRIHPFKYCYLKLMILFNIYNFFAPRFYCSNGHRDGTLKIATTLDHSGPESN